MKTVIEMARKAGLPTAWISESGIVQWAQLERFAALVRADEREACAKLCDELHLEGEDNTGLAADMIRARGNT